MENQQAVKYLVLLHGLGRSRYSMSYLGSKMRKHGYKVFNYGYASLRHDITTHSNNFEIFLKKNIKEGSALNFVTHSLGSIILRKFALSNSASFKLNRAVMLGPPNKGSQLALKLSKSKIISKILGPSFLELSRLALSEANHEMEIGVIAGGRNKEKGILPFLTGDNDGIVRVEETYLEGAKDMLILKGIHSFLMFQPKIIHYTINFLEHGYFQHTDNK